MAKTKQEKLEAKLEREYYRKHRSQIKKTPADRVFDVINYTMFGCFTLICIFPFYYLFINTISDNKLVQKGLISFFPRGINFDNYIRILQVNDLFRSIGVTFARTFLGTAMMVGASALVGYLVTRQEMWGRSIWYRFIVVTMYFNAGIIPWFLNMSMLGLTNNFLAYVIPGIVAPYNIILVKTYIESSIPMELQETAKLDGATSLQIFFKVIWPLSKPSRATIAIFGAVGQWNSFQDSLILMQSAPELYTLQHRLYIYLNASSNLSALMSAGSTSGISQSVLDSALNGKVIKYTISMVTIIPILCVYPFMQRYFEKGIMLGAVKG